MAAKTKTYKELIAMAEEYGVENNALFVSAADNYQIQKKLIDRIRDAIEHDETVVAKEYVKGRENVTAHPLVKELPKHVDSANKSLTIMLNIISTLGTKRSIGDKLGEFMNGE